jgi:phosphoenolpyruvate carboxykinase (GTP)
VREAFDWDHGVFLGATMSSETTAAAAGEVGALRFDPFAMLPFCGYNMAEYFEHWLEIGRSADPAKLPRIFYVNWFRKGDDGHFLWPGFGENSRVLEWVFRRCAGDADAHETPIGLVPAPGDLYTGDLDIPAEDLDAVLTVDIEELREQLPQIKEHLAIFGDQLPAELRAQLEALEARLNGA